MAPLQITCTGSSTIHARAERAVVFITVSSEGPSQSQVSQDVVGTSNTIQAHLRTLSPKDEAGAPHPSAVLTHWSMSALSTGSWQPTDQSGEPQPRVFSASTRIEARFREFAALGTFAGELAETKYVAVERIEWRLTEETRAALGRRCRRDAVKDAMLKAKDYADAAGKADFEILEITDAESASGSGYGEAMRAVYRSAPGEDQERS